MLSPTQLMEINTPTLLRTKQFSKQAVGKFPLFLISLLSRGVPCLWNKPLKRSDVMRSGVWMSESGPQVGHVDVFHLPIKSHLVCIRSI